MKKTLELRLTFTVDPEAQARLTPAEAHTLDTAYILFKGLQDRGVPQDPHALETIREIRLRNGLASRPQRMLGPGGPKEARDQAVATRKEEERQAALSAISANGGTCRQQRKPWGSLGDSCTCGSGGWSPW